MKEYIILTIKMLIVIVLTLPAVILTALIWLMGGWTKGLEDMTNPAYALADWLNK